MANGWLYGVTGLVCQKHGVIRFQATTTFAFRSKPNVNWIEDVHIYLFVYCCTWCCVVLLLPADIVLFSLVFSQMLKRHKRSTCKYVDLEIPAWSGDGGYLATTRMYVD